MRRSNACRPTPFRGSGRCGRQARPRYAWSPARLRGFPPRGFHGDGPRGGRPCARERGRSALRGAWRASGPGLRPARRRALGVGGYDPTGTHSVRWPSDPSERGPSLTERVLPRCRWHRHHRACRRNEKARPRGPCSACSRMSAPSRAWLCRQGEPESWNSIPLDALGRAATWALTRASPRHELSSFGGRDGEP
jgi:hypothetical protein